MKKIYAILALSTVVFAGNAQTAKKADKNATATTVSAFRNGTNHTNALVCDTLRTITVNDTLVLYTAGTSTAGVSNGYVGGNDVYGDIKKGTFFPANLIPAGGSITGVIAQFFKANASRGTHGTGNLSMEIFAGDTTSGPTGTAVATSTTNLTVVGTTGTQVGNSLIYTFPFASVTAPTAGFFAIVVLPTAAGDTAVLFNTRNRSASTHNYAWEYYGTTWASFGTDWNLPSSLSLYAIVCANSSGIHSNILEASLGIYPNPTSGDFNFAISLPEETNLSVSVVNTLGQTVFSKVENNVKAAVFNYDLSSLGKGVYFAHFTDSKNNSVVKRIVIE